jgi:hypothetical protein
MTEPVKTSPKAKKTTHDAVLKVIEQLRNSLPPTFHGVLIDELTGGMSHWRTIQNQDSLGLLPPDLFFKLGKKKMVIRDTYLDFVKQQILADDPY